MTVRHVPQLDAFGCGIACVAMVARLDYADVRALIDPAVAHRMLVTPGTGGLTHYVLFELLSHLGFACIHLFETNQRTFRPREPWPPEPFADAHIVLLPLPSGAHWVLWLPDGTVLDPAATAPKRLDDYCVPPSQVIGIVPVAKGLP